MSEKPHLDEIDSEIALTALLAAGVTGYSSPSLELYPYVKLAAVGLLALTLAKRVGILNGLTGDDLPIRVATHLMDPATNIAFIYLCYVATRWGIQLLDATTTPGTLVLTFGAAVPIITFGVFLASEFLFRGPLREGERIFAASAEQHQGEVLGSVLYRVSGFVATHRTGSRPATRQTKLTDLRFYDIGVEDMTWEEQKNVVRSFGVLIISTGLALLLYLALVVGATMLFDISVALAALLLFGVLVVSAFFRIWYSNYGLVQVEDRIGYLTVIGESITYAVICLLAL
jgi:hypothetical protein